MAAKTKPESQEETAAAEVAAQDQALAEVAARPAPAQLYYRVAALRPSFHAARHHWTDQPEFVPVEKLADWQVEELHRSPFVLIDGPMEKPR